MGVIVSLTAPPNEGIRLICVSKPENFFDEIVIALDAIWEDGDKGFIGGRFELC